MPTITLVDIGAGPDPFSDHVHVEEDLTSQIDGYSLSFNTSQSYIPGSLVVIYNGVTYTKDNDFSETGDKEFTFFSGEVDDPFPPQIGCPLLVIYRREPN